MKTKIRPIGNSAAVILPKTLLDEGNATIGTAVDISYKADMGGYFIEIPHKKTVEKSTKLSREFERWLHTFLKEDKTLLDELADR